MEILHAIAQMSCLRRIFLFFTFLDQQKFICRRRTRRTQLILATVREESPRALRHVVCWRRYDISPKEPWTICAFLSVTRTLSVVDVLHYFFSSEAFCFFQHKVRSTFGIAKYHSKIAHSQIQTSVQMYKKEIKAD